MIRVREIQGWLDGVPKPTDDLEQFLVARYVVEFEREELPSIVYIYSVFRVEDGLVIQLCRHDFAKESSTVFYYDHLYYPEELRKFFGPALCDEILRKVGEF